jgi:hypothetical protein
MRATCGHCRVSKEFGLIHMRDEDEPQIVILARHSAPSPLLFLFYTLNAQTDFSHTALLSRIYLLSLLLTLLVSLSNSEQYSISDGYHLSPPASGPAVLSSTACSAPRELELFQRVSNFSRADTSPYRAEKQSLGGDLRLIRTHETRNSANCDSVMHRRNRLRTRIKTN